MEVAQLEADPNVELKELPDEIFAALRKYHDEAAAELAERDEFSARVQQSINEFMALSTRNLKLAEHAYLTKRIYL